MIRRTTRRPLTWTLTGRILIGVLIASVSGCAILTMRSPKTTDPSVRPRCSNGRGAEILDGAFVLIYGAGALSGGLPLLALAAAHAGSAYAGHKSAKRCEKARVAHEDWSIAQSDQEERSRMLKRQARALRGSEGKACFASKMCKPGLVCDRNTRKCVRPQTGAGPQATNAAPARGKQPASPAVASPAVPATARPAAARPAAAPPGTATTRTARQTPPAAQPRPPVAQPRPASPPPAQRQPPAAKPQPPAAKPQPPAARPQPPAARPQPPPAKKPPPKRERPDERPPTNDKSDDPPGDTPWSDFWREVNL